MKLMLRILALPIALVATLVLASCGTSPGALAEGGATTLGPVVRPPVPVGPTPTATGTPSPVGPPGTGPANTVDLDLANTMSFYHRYEEVLADLTPTRAKDAKVKALAVAIKKAQGPEITRMAGWLTGAGYPVPVIQDRQVFGHQMPGMGGATKEMVSKAEMTALSKATGSSFDRMWLPLMIRHHEGAAVTAKANLANGINPDAKKLAQTIIDRQSGEIATMKSILAGISG